VVTFERSVPAKPLDGAPPIDTARKAQARVSQPPLRKPATT
jgi:hypothetical protein